MDQECKTNVNSTKKAGPGRSRKNSSTPKTPRKYYRKIDSLGRVTLPSKIRKSLDIQTEDELRFYTTDNDEIILTMNGPSCIFCDSPYEIVKVRDVYMCVSCLKELKQFADTEQDS